MKIERIGEVTKITDLLEIVDLDKTLDCGQCFRWNKHKSVWVGVVKNKIVYLCNAKFSNGEIGITTNIMPNDIESLIDYLNLDMNYTGIFTNQVDLSDDTYANSCYERSKGLHILKQDVWETMVSFITSQQNNIPRIKGLIEKLSDKYGDIITASWNGLNITKHGFPTVEQLKDASISDFESLGFGFRSKYIYALTQEVYKDEHYFDKLKESKYPVDMICKLYGIGPKVANCINLFALNNYNSFPIDVHIQDIINREYHGEIDIDKFNGYAGIVQQFMFYSEIR